MSFGIVSCVPCDFLRNAIISIKIFFVAVRGSDHSSAPCLDIQFNKFSECLWTASNQVGIFSIGWVVHVAKQLVVHIKLNRLRFIRWFQACYSLLDQKTSLRMALLIFKMSQFLLTSDYTFKWGKDEELWFETDVSTNWVEFISKVKSLNLIQWQTI